MPGVESNTLWKCNGCGTIIDVPGEFPNCPNCGAKHFSQIAVVPVCDFCSTNESDGWWDYPCADFLFDFIMLPGPQGGSKGPWRACQDCHELIERDDRAMLIKRSVDRELDNHPERKAHYNLAWSLTRRMHNGFFKHRSGDARKEEPDDQGQGG